MSTGQGVPVLGDDPNPDNEPRHVMLDLETLGTKSFAPVVAIGAVAFRMDDSPITESTDMFYQSVTLESNFDVGLRPDPSTLKWWLTDPHVTQQAREGTFNHPGACPLPQALDLFTDWLNSRPMQLWGNSARFDLGLLENAYKACGKNAPWSFKLERCYRTIKNLPAARVYEIPSIGTHHNALDDAVAQALHLRLISKMLNLHL